MLDPAIPALRRLDAWPPAVLVDALLAHSPSTIFGDDPEADKDLFEALKVATTELGLSDELLRSKRPISLQRRLAPACKAVQN